MKDYYEILEVSKTASQETIERVYKLLAKKYHPDVTKAEDKAAAEEKFKEISQAYETLSNVEKRKSYDLKLEQTSPNVSYEDYESLVNEKNNLQNELYNLKKSSNFHTTSQNSNTYNNKKNYNMNTNNSNQASNTYNTSNSNQTSNSKKRTYYYTDTGKPASVFAYYKYRIKKIISDIGFILLAILALILMLNAILPINIFKFLYK